MVFALFFRICLRILGAVGFFKQRVGFFKKSLEATFEDIGLPLVTDAFKGAGRFRKV